MANFNIREMFGHRKALRSVIAEFFGMFFFLLVTIGTVMSTGVSAAGKLRDSSDILTIALSFGISIFVLAHAIGPVSGGHLNPAVTVAMCVYKKMDPLLGVCYVVAQIFWLGPIIGGVLGASLHQIPKRLLAPATINPDTPAGPVMDSRIKAKEIRSQHIESLDV